MDRRAFLKLLGMATATAIAAPSVVVEAYAVPAAPVVTALPEGIRGLAYMVQSSGTYFDMTRPDTFPILKPPSLESTAQPFTRCVLENVKGRLHAT